MMVFAMIIAGVIAFFAEIIFRSLMNSRNWGRPSRESDGKGGGGMALLIAAAIIGVAWLLSIVIRFALSRSREYLADAGSVELTKNPDAMISALRKIENRGELNGATSAVMEMCIDNPREGFVDLFATHPSVDARVRALVKFAGGHDIGPITRLEDIAGPQDTESDAPPTDKPRRGPWDALPKPPFPLGPPRG
jgi:heat shock protein HtpX